jgi:hypothetical protein
MSLTTNDLQQIRNIVEDIVNPLRGDIEALSNDIKEIYNMIAELQKSTRPIAHFENNDLEKKILEAYKDILNIAKEAGVELPR